MVHMHHLYANTYHGFQKSTPQMKSPTDRRVFLETYIKKYDFDELSIGNEYDIMLNNGVLALFTRL